MGQNHMYKSYQLYEIALLTASECYCEKKLSLKIARIEKISEERG